MVIGQSTKFTHKLEKVSKMRWPEWSLVNQQSSLTSWKRVSNMRWSEWSLVNQQSSHTLWKRVSNMRWSQWSLVSQQSSRTDWKRVSKWDGQNGHWSINKVHSLPRHVQGTDHGISDQFIRMSPYQFTCLTGKRYRFRKCSMLLPVIGGSRSCVAVSAQLKRFLQCRLQPIMSWNKQPSEMNAAYHLNQPSSGITPSFVV